MSNVSRGQKKEKTTSDMLEAEGFVVEFRSTRTQFQRIDYGYRPTKEERETCECGRKLGEHGSLEGRPYWANDENGQAKLFCKGFKMKRLTGWKAAKFDIVARKPGILILVSCKIDCAHLAEEKRNIEDYRRYWELDQHTRTEIWDFHKPRWRGRGKNKRFEEANVEKVVIE